MPLTDPVEAQAYVDQLPVAAWVCDRDGRIIAHNWLVCRLWRTDPDPLDPNHLYCASSELRTLDGEFIAPHSAIAAQAMESGSAREASAVMTRADGTTITVRASSRPCLDADGSIGGALAVLVDVTEEHRAKETLRESEQRLKLALEATRLGPWGLEPGDGRGVFLGSVERSARVAPPRRRAARRRTGATGSTRTNETKC